jgi:hypothetical protein
LTITLRAWVQWSLLDLFLIFGVDLQIFHGGSQSFQCQGVSNFGFPTTCLVIFVIASCRKFHAFTSALSLSPIELLLMNLWWY